MTQEQKPESAEFRTKKWDGLPENQANDGWHWLTHVITHSPTPYLWKASSGVWIGDSLLQFYPNSAWCARRQYMGRARAPTEELADQRQKDAEGAEPIKWQRDKPGNGWIDTPVEDLPFYRERGFSIRPLYTRPANVAALIAEAVAAERERCAMLCEALAQNISHERGSLPDWETGEVTLDELSQVEFEAFEKSAAAIREGRV